ncbi:MAG: FAD-dependent oxidoreductase, partial [Chloroflexota bacterium]
KSSFSGRVPEELLLEAGLLQRGGETGRVYDRFRNRLTIEIRDGRGEVLGFGARALGDDNPKYLNSPEGPRFSKGRILYGLDLAREGIRKSDEVILVEGYFDRIAFDRAGVPQAVASMGTALTPAQADLLGRHARTVVVAAGAWSRQIASPIVGMPVVPLPMRPVKGQILRLQGERIIQHVVRTPDVYLVPREDGELVIGASMEDVGFDERSRAGAVHDLLREARRAVPGIAELDLVECGVGFRPALRDHLPAIGNVDGAGLFVATGHFRNGVELAPITARLLADLICDGRLDPLLEPFAPGRFAPAAPAEATR